MKVQEIVTQEAKTGMGKNGKPWSTAKVELEDGQQVYIFNPIAIGDEVEEYENNGYKNWRKVKQQAGSAELATIINMLMDMNKKIDTLMGNFQEEPVSEDDFPL